MRFINVLLTYNPNKKWHLIFLLVQPTVLPLHGLKHSYTYIFNLFKEQAANWSCLTASLLGMLKPSFLKQNW